MTLAFTESIHQAHQTMHQTQLEQIADLQGQVQQLQGQVQQLQQQHPQGHHSDSDDDGSGDSVHLSD